jgi:aspartate oxidase
MRQAMERKESRGLHYNIDHPKSEAWKAFEPIIESGSVSASGLNIFVEK